MASDSVVSASVTILLRFIPSSCFGDPCCCIEPGMRGGSYWTKVLVDVGHASPTPELVHPSSDATGRGVSRWFRSVSVMQLLDRASRLSAAAVPGREVQHEEGRRNAT